MHILFILVALIAIVLIMRPNKKASGCQCGKEPVFLDDQEVYFNQPLKYRSEWLNKKDVLV